MDLIALATIDEKVHVYRLNGQRVFGVVSKPSVARVNQIRWKPNGKNTRLPWQGMPKACIDLSTRSIISSCV